MRSPDAALIRARAKAPLPDLLALHLSKADIECIKHLELCKSLQSLYADGNHVKDIEGIVELRKLWKLDLNDNLLRNLHALASFRALGFLYLERNKIDFEDLVCIRDVHLLEMRLVGNTGLLKGNTTNEYRKKVVALLPNVWILDGHFITTTEREQAVEDFDQFVSSLLKQPQRSAGVVSKFGSATDVWVESEITTDNSAERSCSSNFIGVAHKSPPPEEPPDMRRLHAVVLFHNEESTIHNAHNHFAPSRYAPNARLMPKVWLDEVLALPRRTRLEFIVLVATFLEFRFPKVLMLEALLIRQLDCPHFPSEAIRDTVDLPPYALVALVAVARHYSIKEEQTKRDELRQEVTSPEFEDESAILSAIPPLFSTLLSPQNGSIAPQDSSELQATAIRCRQAIRLLSNVASFPDPEMVAFKGKGNRDSVFRELMPLIRAAEAVQANSTTQSGREVVPSVTVTNYKSADVSISKHNSKMMWKRSPITEKPSDIPGENQEYTVNLDRIAPTGSATRRKPKPGDWVEVRLKLFVKIQFLSADGLFVVGSSPTNSSRAITISIEQLSRISSTVWRVKHLTKEQAVGLFTNTQHTNSDCFSTDKARVGKLHRDSEAFHRHGAARNQGFPNHFVTTEILADLARQRSPSSSRPKSIEIFSSNDTLDANYVLTSPEHISAQNFCAVSTFQRDRRPARGLWSPMKQCAPYSVLTTSTPTPSLETSLSLRELKTRKPRAQSKAMSAPPPDDWLEIRREMQAQLGIAGVSDDTERPSTSSSVGSLDSVLQTRTDVSSFLTTVSDTLPRGESASQDTNCAVAADPGPARRRPLGTRRSVVGAAWHQVPTKTEFVVAAALGASPSAPQLRPPPTLKLVVLPSLRSQNKV